MVDLLAEVTDVQEFLGRDLTSDEAARAEAILGKASELFRNESGQTFTAGESTNRLIVRGGADVYLPQRPVVSVVSVTDEDGNAIAHTVRGQAIRLGRRASWAIVSYTHGGPVPDLVRLAVAEIAAVVLRVDASAASGATQASETTGPFTRQATYATWAVGGSTRLSPDDVALARSFRNPWRQMVTLGS